MGQKGAEMSAQPNMSPLQVFQPAANQRLSCRKITCKAFPFVVEEHRVTSYFFLVKKKNRRAAGDLVDLSPWFICFLPVLPAAGRRDLRCSPCGLFSPFCLLLLGWKRLAEITEERSLPLEQESKSVGRLLRWLWMFSATAFYGSPSVALKGEGMHLGSLDFWFCFSLVFLLSVRWGVGFLFRFKADVVKWQPLCWSLFTLIRVFVLIPHILKLWVKCVFLNFNSQV